MRSDEDKEIITKNLIDPFSIEGFLSREEIDELISVFNSSPDTITKNTKTVSVSVKFYNSSTPTVLKRVIEKLEDHIGPFEVFDSLFFKAVYPHIVHNDDNFNFPLLHKAVTLPLQLEYEDITSQCPSLCFFDQYYLNGPAKFFNGHEGEITSFYNTPIYEYSNVLNKKLDGISNDLQSKYFTHLDPKWLEGLTVHSIIPWVPGNAIVFDCARLHAASDFRKLGIKSKLGLSIFTQKKK